MTEEQIREHLSEGVDREALLILSAVTGSDWRVLKRTLWTACMVRFALARPVRLVIRGEMGAEMQRRLEAWQVRWRSAGIVRQVGEEVTWDELLRACDVVLSGEAVRKGRSWLEKSSGGAGTDCWWVTGPGEGDGETAEERRVRAESLHPRHLAAAVLSLPELAKDMESL